MKVPFSWLKQYVDIDVSAQELETKLFDCGFEVEELIDLGAEISKVVVGVVTECVPQEGTHLHICKVDCGDYGHDIQISTGASNVYAGMHTPAALDGSTLPGGIKIKAKPLMGIESNGMLCSGEELGLNEDLYPGAEVYGLLDLPKDTVPGTPIQQVVGLDDYIFDISITANRADCQSVLGIAREVAAVLNKPLKMPATDYTVSDYKDPRLSITVEAPDLCPRYLGHYVRNITTGESPRWMRRQLALCGLRSISNVVDITNYVMLEIGQPMHAFDMDTLESCQIIVRRAKNGEKITTLDSKEFTLTPQNLVICDGEKPVALAGVMGGLNSEIKPETTQLLFESAKFARDNIRKTARGLGQNTDASAHYEKGISEYTTELGMARALHLIQELGCGEVTATEFDCSAGAPRKGKHFTARISAINAILGITVPTEEILAILKKLSFEVTMEADGDTMQVVAPRYREDIEIGEPDLAEEVIREYGYDHITPTFLKAAQVTTGGLTADQHRRDKLKSAMCAQGFYEAMTLAFYADADLDALHIAPDAAPQHSGRYAAAAAHRLLGAGRAAGSARQRGGAGRCASVSVDQLAGKRPAAKSSLCFAGNQFSIGNSAPARPVWQRVPRYTGAGGHLFCRAGTGHLPPAGARPAPDGQRLVGVRCRVYGNHGILGRAAPACTQPACGTADRAGLAGGVCFSAGAPAGISAVCPLASAARPALPQGSNICRVSTGL